MSLQNTLYRLIDDKYKSELNKYKDEICEIIINKITSNNDIVLFLVGEYYSKIKN